MGAAVVFGIAALMATKTVPGKEALAGYGDSVVWLVAAAFLFAHAVVESGLGKRIALTLVHWWGGTMIGLGYAVCGAELILGPAIPSNTARGGGVLSPIVRALSEALDSRADHHPGARGAVSDPARRPCQPDCRRDVFNRHGGEPRASSSRRRKRSISTSHGQPGHGGRSRRGLFGLAILPWFMRWLTKPTVTDTRPAQEAARAQLG